MIVHATVDEIAPKFRAGLVTAIWTPEDAANARARAAEHQTACGTVAVVR